MVAAKATQRTIIASMAACEFKIPELRPFQLEAIRVLVYGLSTLLLVQGTGGGKSEVFFGAGLMLGGVCLCVAPLLGLGTAQAARASELSGVLSYHLDELKRGSPAANELAAYLGTLTKENEPGSRRSLPRAVFLFVSPQALLKGKLWGDVVRSLLDRSLVSLTMIDEMHKIPLEGVYFRKEMALLDENLFAHIKKSQRDVAVLAATATLTAGLLSEFERMMTSVVFTEYLWGSVKGRHTLLKVSVKARSVDTFKSELSEHCARHPTHKAIVLTSEKARAKNNLRDVRIGQS
jgi:superfamily II DNA helicase RecQ